jgi:hypothetical protein
MNLFYPETFLVVGRKKDIFFLIRENSGGDTECLNFIKEGVKNRRSRAGR